MITVTLYGVTLYGYSYYICFKHSGLTVAKLSPSQTVFAMTRLAIIFFVIVIPYFTVIGQECTTNADCYTEEPSCQEDMIAMYDVGDY